MNWFVLISIIVVSGLVLFCVVGVLIGHPWFVQDYPKHLEKRDELKFDKNKKARISYPGFFYSPAPIKSYHSNLCRLYAS